MSHVSKKTRPTSKSRKQVPLNCKIAGDANTTVHWFVCLDGKCKQIDRPKSKSGQTECRQLYEAARAMAPNQKPYDSIRPRDVFKLYVDTNSHSRTNYMLEYHPSKNIKKIATAVGLFALGAGATLAYQRWNAPHQKLFVTHNGKKYIFSIQASPGKFFKYPVYYSNNAQVTDKQVSPMPTLLLRYDDWWKLHKTYEKAFSEEDYMLLNNEVFRDNDDKVINKNAVFFAVWKFPAELYKYKEFNLITDPVPVGSTN